MSSAFVVLNETRLTSRLLLYRSSAERWAGVRLVDNFNILQLEFN